MRCDPQTGKVVWVLPQPLLLSPLSGATIAPPAASARAPAQPRND